MKNSCVILAAGNSERFQGNKLLHFIGKKRLIEHLFDKVKEVAFDQVCVVTQYPFVMQLCEAYGFTYVENLNPSLGISSSIHLGVRSVADSDRILFLVADQPLLKVKTLKQLIQCDRDEIIACEWRGKIVNPMVFPRRYYDELLSLTGDNGGKKIALQHPFVTIKIQEEEGMDMDTKEDWEILKKLHPIE